MIDFNLKDDNMSAIARLTGLSNLQTRNTFRIYGLAEDGNPPILFSAQENYVTAEQEKSMTAFLANNGIDSATEDVSAKDKKVYIGLRRDVRENPELCARLLETFVYYIEGRLELVPDFKVPNIPAFKTNVVPEKK